MKEKIGSETMEILTFLYYFLLIMWYIGAIVLIIYLYNRNYKPYPNKFNQNYYEDLPSDLEPGELSILLYRKITPQVFTTVILSLIKKGALELKIYEDDYHFKVMNASGRIKLSRSETVVKDFLMSIGKMGEFSLKEMANYCGTKKGDTEFLFQFDLWKKVLRRESSKRRFFDEKQGYGMVKLVKNFGILLLIANFVGGYHLFTGYSTILPILFLPFFFSILYRRTEYYSEEYEKWLAFANYLDNLNNLKKPDNVHDFTMSAIVLKKMEALYNYAPNDKSIVFANTLHQTLMKCYRHAYLNGNRSITSIWNLK